MGLRLKQIYLKNWKCYREQNIRLNLDTERNVWIIFGQNGYGKTSILEAILWCLYGGEAITKSELLICFNNLAVKKNPELEMTVRLTFEQDGKQYFIGRAAKRVVRGITIYPEVEEAVFYEDSKPKPDSRESIETILPKSCKDFFFFDGVKIQRYAQITQTQETRQAIERILGIPELKNLRDDANKARQNRDKQLEEASAANKILIEVIQELAEIEGEIEITEGQLETTKQDNIAADKILKDVQLRASKIEELKSQLNELNHKEQEQSLSKERLKSLEKKVESAIRKTSITLMLEFVREVADDLQRKSMANVRRSGSVAQLQELLKSDICWCGRCIDDNARTYIRKQLENVESSSKLAQEAVEQTNLRDRLAVLARYQMPNFDKLLLERDEIQNELDEITQAIARLKRDTEGINKQEASEIWKKVFEAEQMKKETQQKASRLQQEIEQLNKKADNLRREREQLAGQDKETRTLAKQVKLARGLRDAADELIKWRIEQCKQTIESQTSRLHQRVTNKPNEYTGVEIQENYTLGVKTVNGDILSPEILSAGEKEALAFAFIAGLNLASGKAAPLVMDTPFGHLDTQHQKNIVNALPNIPSQVIVLATDRDFPDYLLQKFRSHVAEIHHIRRLKPTEAASSVEVEK